jgi:hypothetical protein
MESQKINDSLNPIIHSITENEYTTFVNLLPELASLSPDISQVRDFKSLDQAKLAAASLFSSLIETMDKRLRDPAVGIAVVDIAQSDTLDATLNAYWGVVVALSLTKNLFEPARDRVNGTPYTIYAASHEKSKQLTSMGLPGVAPETKLGFHTDGLLTDEGVAMPLNIMLYNILIEYNKPGNFYWAPFSLWPEKDRYMQSIGLGQRYKIMMTPSIYESDNGKLETVSPRQVEAPIFVPDASFDYPMYLNGTVIEKIGDANFDGRLIEDMKTSLSNSAPRFLVPQKARRIIFARNISGAHARDIFESPNRGAPYTRIFMRSVDQICIPLQ